MKNNTSDPNMFRRITLVILCIGALAGIGFFYWASVNWIATSFDGGIEWVPLGLILLAGILLLPTVAVFVAFLIWGCITNFKVKDENGTLGGKG